MGRLLGIDYGLKRIGIAVTDPLLIISYPLITIENKDIFKFIDEYFKKEIVDKVVIGDPVIYNGETNIKSSIDIFINDFKIKYPDKDIVLFNERYTSNIAKYYLKNGSFKKKDRANKANLDKISASVILSQYLDSIKNKTTL